MMYMFNSDIESNPLIILQYESLPQYLSGLFNH